MTTSALRRALASTITGALALGLISAGAGVATAQTQDAAPAAAATDAPAGTNSSFLLPVLPDTQFYSRYSASQFYPKYGTNPFEVQTKWIVDHKNELNIPFVVQVGDVVDQQGVSGEWDAAAKAMKNLTDGGVPYSVLPGNHDVSDMNARSSEAISGNYRARFGADAMAAQSAKTGSTLLGTFQDGLSSAYLFEAEGHQWISLAIAWNASDDTFGWAQGILDQHPKVPVVLSSHAIINIAEDQTSPTSWWWGDVLWDQLIRKNDQIILTVNGHFHGATQQTRTNDFGHPVHQILTDYQMAADGGNGVMTLFEFDLTGQKIDVDTVSPWIPMKDKASLASSDTPVLTGPNQQFSMPFDFNGRFGWKTDPANETKADLSSLATKIVSEGWTGGGTANALLAAGSPNDYIPATGTIAHWRFGSVGAGVVDENTVIPDVAGSSPMHRNAIGETDEPDELADVNVSHSNTAFYSSDPGSVCFTNATRNASGPDRVSYLTTEYGAPATFADLNKNNGYTIETFLQLDENWTESANRWSAALTRGGTREWSGIHDDSDPGAGVAWLGISNLREYQYSAADSSTGNSYTNWSGEIMQKAWHHVAIVNDPAANTVIMYVDGVPVLRNVSNAGGMMAANFMPWIIGTSTLDTEAEHGWNGCVGETRIVDHPLTTKQFLYNRPDIDATGANFALATDLSTVYPSDTQLASLTGRGLPGASVRVEATGDADGASLGQADVAADGTWRIDLAEPLSGSGSHALTFVQSMGSRNGKSLSATLVIGEKSGWTPSDSDLTPALENAITVTPNPFVAGENVSIALPAGHEGQTVYGFAFSEPTALGTAVVTAGNSLTLATPASLPAGEHRIALYTSTGELIGWQLVTARAAGDTGGGSGTGPDIPGTDPTPGTAASTTGDTNGGDTNGGTTGGLAVTGLSIAGILALAAGALVAGIMLLRARRARS
ncbi:LamG-like jellyroll fold domain-containing protein [Agreia bicolorata]|nr:LamG-like jellyroll fold domain-containing protein [Agreia bicolorata]